ncbi:HAD family hydrolase [Uliginosibacterium gangwonense]|uniref:HAD family hydrolase n=1 Tax=Uliginosibacterium gangwonense TaxID=392736 RepID=UPI0003A5AD2A|nr:HAD family phosphatase [Uliginosibacterium gangwonense]
MVLHLPRPQAVIFDMDGLLLDSERIALAHFAQAAHDIGAPWSEEIGLRMVGLTPQDSDAMLCTTYGDDYPVDALRDRFGELYEQAILNGIPLKPFVRELIERLRLMEIPCAVATSTHRKRAEAKLARSQLLANFKALACGDEVIRGKPAPDIFEVAAARLGVAPNTCLALEDSNAGVRAAISANMTVVMVPDMLRPDPDIRRYGVACVESLKDVLVALSN